MIGCATSLHTIHDAFDRDLKGAKMAAALKKCSVENETHRVKNVWNCWVAYISAIIRRN